MEGSSGRARRMEGSQRVLPKDASESACKTRSLGQKHTSACKLFVCRARVRYGVERSFSVRETAERLSDCESLRARADCRESSAL